QNLPQLFLFFFFFFLKSEKVYQSSNSLTRPNHTVAWPLVLCQEVYKFCQIKHADSLFILQCLYQYLTSALPLRFSLLLTVYSSDRLMDDTISIAMATKENVTFQRGMLKSIQSKVNTLANRFPAINNLIQRINLRKRRDSLILGAVIGVCTILLLLYAFH
uniref:Golgi SNAP receptor complex member 1 n=1 Tax=Haplochromis burtoni TaxID=8153 RepID=A0A3Q2WWR1_HAPBU